MAVHRSPGGRSARRPTAQPYTAQPYTAQPYTAQPYTAALRTVRRSAPAHSAVTRVNALASAAAVGAVATGTLTSLIPVVEAPAQADGAPVEATLAAVSVPLTNIDVDSAPNAFLPVRTPTAENAPTDAQLAQLDKADGIAQQIAALHAEQQAEQAEQAKLGALVAEGGLDGWIAEALTVMDLPLSLAPGIKKIILKESNGNPKAINRWDSNARRGTPSQGLMQTIPTTFRAFVHPSLAHLSITHPVANITAGVRYMIATYGMDTLEQGGRRSASGAYKGY